MNSAEALARIYERTFFQNVDGVPTYRIACSTYTLRGPVAYDFSPKAREAWVLEASFHYATQTRRMQELRNASDLATLLEVVTDGMPVVIRIVSATL